MYDGTTADPINPTATLSGTVLSETTSTGKVFDQVFLVSGSGSANFADPNVGTNKTVTFSGYSITGADAADYALSQPTTTTAAITPATGVTITASSQSETYGFGGTSAALGTTAFTASGLFGSDSVTSVTLSTNATLSSSSNYNAGTWDITPSAAIGSGLSNYTITYDENSTGLTVAAKALTVTALNQSRAYGVTDPSFTGSITEFVSITGFVNGDFLDSSKLTGFPTLTPTDTGPSSPVGKYTIKCFQPDLQDPQNLSYSDTNYTLASFQPGTLTITPVPLTITANNQNEPYGFGGTSAALGTTAFTYSGQLLSSDSVTSVTLATNATHSGSSNYNVGTWTITPSAAIGSGLSNYTITYANASTGLTVAQKELQHHRAFRHEQVYDSTTADLITGSASLIGNGAAATR